MKNSKAKFKKTGIVLILLVFLFGITNLRAQCPTVVTNQVACQQNISIDWYFTDQPGCSPSFPGCSSGTAVIPWNTSFTITCPGGSCGTLCDFYLRASSGGFTSPWIDFLSTNPNTGKVYLCPGNNGTCCDFGTILFYDPVNGKAWVN